MAFYRGSAVPSGSLSHEPFLRERQCHPDIRLVNLSALRNKNAHFVMPDLICHEVNGILDNFIFTISLFYFYFFIF
ncbi:MAG TPA: hypothetical protein VJ577_07985 [Burkholderiaceae bacterium]|nr:hypothetical protein [Burkholderiaceae bacterium]